MKVRFFDIANPLHWISVAAITLALLDTFIVSISVTSLGLLAIAALPWIINIFRSIELPGGLKLEMKELKSAEQELTETGLLQDVKTEATPSYISVAERDPNLALAGLRIELEKRLRDLAQEHNMAGAPLHRILSSLASAGVITERDRSVIADLMPALNAAVHGAEVSPDAYDWAISVGPQILGALDQLAASQGRGSATSRRAS